MPLAIIYTNESGGVALCMPAPELNIEFVRQKDIPADVESFIVNTEDLPFEHNDLFDAWEQTNGVVTVNFAKAQELTKARLRLEREPLLTAQDVAFQRALEIGADTSTIVAEKQRLRDLTSLADTCTTLDELRALHP